MDVKLEKRSGQRLPMAILGGAVSTDGATLIGACMDGVYKLDLANGERQQLYSHDSYASSVHWLADDIILSGGYDGTLRWFDLKTSELKRELPLHEFWSWQTAVSPDQSLFASVTGQYLAGGYKYEPAAEREPSLVIGETATGEILHRLPHVPSVQSVAFSHDGKRVAAGNLMGEVRIFSCETGDLQTTIQTPDFTSWGIIKSHCYLGGIFALRFAPDDQSILLAGMGPMRDPMAGNGKQLWQRWETFGDTPKMLDQTHEGENGEGLMESLALHPNGKCFAMGGRLRGGDWNVALFSLEDGKRLTRLKTGYRVTTMHFAADGKSLVVIGTQGQPGSLKDGKFPDFGRVEIYDVAIEQG
ncbi:WD40 repeat domain-containing protein [Rhodopirellula sp. MGV]|uniref:WD40 repeat domain-containing protein n=1 Tax=Rhodopirellula sp. MGV TaxID=2023130 RepID=UPI000B96DFA0|nr:hypothetical protein [Rhodopirellula sp. MGV]OYP38507.1 hypothetical protein CGZ80_01780 [Rhodopirellula sp. MGV]PNY33517.1 hypothetical protein C2E31_28280 [Rhodopirellula baltica]